jgi:hypothetical protein
MHAAVLTGPLAWTFVALYWDGAAAVHSHHFAGRVVANVFVWSWLVYGGFYLVAFKDWSMGFCLSVLTAGRSALTSTFSFLQLAAPTMYCLLTCNSNSSRSLSVLDCHCRLAVDLCLHHHGRTLCRNCHCRFP